jgi:hypothetical protein
MAGLMTTAKKTNGEGVDALAIWIAEGNVRFPRTRLDQLAVKEVSILLTIEPMSWPMT